MRRWVRIISALLLVVLPALPAAAQSLCAPRALILDQLERQYGEVPVGRGLIADGGVLELIVSPSGSWSVLISSPLGVSCFASSGEAWEGVDRPNGQPPHGADGDTPLAREKVALVQRVAR